MRSTVPRIVTIALAAAVLVPTPALSQSTGLEDMVGARAGQAEGELARRGYRNVRGEKGDDRSYTYWWNANRRQCVTIATMNGRYDSITPTLPPDCRQQASAERRPPRTARPAQGGGYADGGDLPRICKGEAAAAYDRRPSDITVNMPIRQPNGNIVQGWFEREKRTNFFTCRFDASGRFTSVN